MRWAALLFSLHAALQNVDASWTSWGEWGSWYEDSNDGQCKRVRTRSFDYVARIKKRAAFLVGDVETSTTACTVTADSCQATTIPGVGTSQQIGSTDFYFLKLDSAMTWSEAQTACSSIHTGGASTLAKIESEADFATIYDALSAAGNLPAFFGMTSSESCTGGTECDATNLQWHDGLDVTGTALADIQARNPRFTQSAIPPYGSVDPTNGQLLGLDGTLNYGLCKCPAAVGCSTGMLGSGTVTRTQYMGLDTDYYLYAYETPLTWGEGHNACADVGLGIIAARADTADEWDQVVNALTVGGELQAGWVGAYAKYACGPSLTHQCILEDVRWLGDSSDTVPAAVGYDLAAAEFPAVGAFQNFYATMAEGDYGVLGVGRSDDLDSVICQCSLAT